MTPISSTSSTFHGCLTGSWDSTWPKLKPLFTQLNLFLLQSFSFPYQLLALSSVQLLKPKTQELSLIFLFPSSNASNSSARPDGSTLNSYLIFVYSVYIHSSNHRFEPPLCVIWIIFLHSYWSQSQSWVL